MSIDFLQLSRQEAAGLISGTEWWAAMAQENPEYELGYRAALAADAARESTRPAAQTERQNVYAAFIAAGHSEKSARRQAREAYNEMILDAAFAARREVYAAS